MAMEKQFVDYDTAKVLKKLGFDELCMRTAWDFDLTYGEDIPFPLWQQVEEWLWEKIGKNLHITVEANPKGEFQFFVWDGATNLGFHDDDVYFDSPIDAKKEGIKSAVKYLRERL